MKALTAAEMQEVDRLTTERHGIPSLQLMENGGECVRLTFARLTVTLAARHAWFSVARDKRGRWVVVARLLQLQAGNAMALGGKGDPLPAFSAAVRAFIEKNLEYSVAREPRLAKGVPR